SAMVVAWWQFGPLLESLFVDLTRAPAETLARLSPGFNEYHHNYRLTFSWIAILSIALWYPIARLAVQRGEALPRSLLFGAVAIGLLALASLDYPFRMLYWNRFEAVKWQGVDCYLLGQRADDVLLFCPALQP